MKAIIRTPAFVSTTPRSSTSTMARSSSIRTGSTTPTTTMDRCRGSSRSLSSTREKVSFKGYLFSCQDFVARIQPPSMRPISSTIPSSTMYFFVSIDFVSFVRRIKTRSILSLRLHFSRVDSFSGFFSLLACRIPSITSRIRFSHRSKMVNLSYFGTTFRYSWKSL